VSTKRSPVCGVLCEHGRVEPWMTSEIERLTDRYGLVPPPWTVDR